MTPESLLVSLVAGLFGGMGLAYGVVQRRRKLAYREKYRRCLDSKNSAVLTGIGERTARGEWPELFEKEGAD